MSLEALKIAYEHLPMDPSTWAVLCVLANCHNHTTGQCNPSIAFIESKLKLSRATVKRHLAKLVELGIIERGIAWHGNDCCNKAPSNNRFIQLDSGGSPVSLPRFTSDPTPVHQRPYPRVTSEPQKQEGKQEEKLYRSKLDLDQPEQQSPFDSFWFLYPRKSDKKKAAAAWQKLAYAEQQLALAHLKTSPYAETDLKFTPLPTTYLNGHRWEDESPPQKLQNNQMIRKNGKLYHISESTDGTFSACEIPE